MLVAAAGSSEQKKTSSSIFFSRTTCQRGPLIQGGVTSEAGTRVRYMIGYGFCIPEQQATRVAHIGSRCEHWAATATLKHYVFLFCTCRWIAG